VQLILRSGGRAEPGLVSVGAWIGRARQAAKGLSMSIKLTETQRSEAYINSQAPSDRLVGRRDEAPNIPEHPPTRLKQKIGSTEGRPSPRARWRKGPKRRI
jgi:hypothetical protein